MDFDPEAFEVAEWLMPSEDDNTLANVVQYGLVELKANENSWEEDLLELVLMEFIRYSQLFPQFFWIRSEDLSNRPEASTPRGSGHT